MRNVRAVSTAFENYGYGEVADRIVAQIHNNEVNPNNFSYQGLFEAFFGPASSENVKKNLRAYASRGMEEVKSDAFTSIITNFSFARYMAGYNSVPGVLDQLVDPITNSTKLLEIPGVQLDGGIENVAEGKEYPESGMTDRAAYVIESDKRGGVVKFTEETFLYDQTGLVNREMQQFGQHIRTDRERIGIRRIQDLTSYKCFYPKVSGVPTQKDLYATSVVSATNWYEDFINTKTSNALVDWTDIEAAWLLWKDAKDSKQDEILITPRIILVPYALNATARFIINATSVESRSNSSNNAMFVPSITQQMGIDLTVLTSPYMNDATTWYMGDPKQQFVEHVIMPPSVAILPGDPYKDIVFGVRFRRKSQVFATDNKFFIKNTA